MFSADRVLEVLARVPDAVVDGGWGVDALVGSQTRQHGDLDLVVPLASCDRTLDALRPLRFELELDERPTRVVAANGAARVDLHLVSPVDFGMVQVLPGGQQFSYVLDGTKGTIGGQAVRCLSAPMQVLTHCGYEPDDDDRRDLAAVAEVSGESLPPPYVTLAADDDDATVVVRPATLRDIAALVVVRRRSWIAAYSGRMPQGVIDDFDMGATWLNWMTTLRVPPEPSLRIAVAGAPGAVHGFSVVSACRDEGAADDVGQLRLLYTDPTAWGSRVGVTLMISAVATLRELGFGELRLWTLRENGRARAFYERFGWVADGAEQTTEHPAGSYVEVRYRLVG